MADKPWPLSTGRARLVVSRAMRKLPLAAFALLAATALFPAQASAIDLPYEKTTLDNGLTVIVHQDKSLPIVAVNLLYDVGSRNEEQGRTGFAHLFEHLMFMGTKRAPEKMFDAWMEEAGGSNNAWTSADYTDYHEVGPKGLLPLFLWLEADRMQTLGGEIDKAKLDLQRNVVLNERIQRIENVPYGKVDLVLPEMMYSKGYPYYHPVIGSPEDLRAADVSDVRAFFDKWYVPSNASLVVAGDVTKDEAEDIAKRYFGELPKEPKPDRVSLLAPKPLGEIVRKTIEDRVELPKIVMAWHSPAHFQPGDAELDLLASILSSGKASRLYEALVYEQPIAQSVEAAQWSRQLSSLFVIEVLVRPGVSLDDAEKAIDAVIQKAVAEPPSAEELERARNDYELAFIGGLQSIQSRARALNLYQAETGDPGYVNKDLERYRAATPESVQDFAKKTLDLNQRGILRVIPQSSKPGTGEGASR